LGLNLAQKIIKAHLVEGKLEPGSEIALKIDQTLTQDATGTMAYLQFEAMDLPQVRTELSVSYVDHNTLQTGFENADDHLFLQSIAQKYGIYFSRPGNGICHQVHLERFGQPGKTLLGSDSHTPTGGGIGMLAIGAGGLDVAVAMGGGAFYTPMPKIVNVHLTGQLPAWVTAKDIILELLRLLTVKGGVGKIFEYTGPGVASLRVPQRATITNMGAELGATTSIFPSDQVTREFLAAQGREDSWRELGADSDATYDEVVEINLEKLEPLAAMPHSPDNVSKVSKLAAENVAVNQVAIGSCTNSSYVDLMRVAKILKGRRVHPNVSLVISPGSKQVLTMLSQNGALADMVQAGARILECTCGPCIGMGQAPPTGGVSLRTFNRNFEGRSGTKSAQVYLVSPEVGVASALAGKFTDPRDLGAYPAIEEPESFLIDDGMIIPPQEADVEIRRGPNIKALPLQKALPETYRGKVLLKVGDNITTDHIMPAGAKILPLRSNVPALSQHVFQQVDPSFAQRAQEAGGGIILGGQNYGQGSSREHAALCPMYLGIKAVLAQSFARIHKANLVNFGILPLVISQEDYQKLSQKDELEFPDLRQALAERTGRLQAISSQKTTIDLSYELSERQVAIILAGGLLNYTKNKA
jgi:aconitate hydratase